MLLYFRKAIQDFRENSFLNIISMFTIALALLVVSAFSLFIMNTNALMQSWKTGMRVMAYLRPDVTPAALENVQERIETMYGVRRAVFISKDQALARLKSQMKRQTSLFAGLDSNPLPDAFEITMLESTRDLEKVEALASNLERLTAVADVEYGQRWIGRFSSIIQVFSLAAYGLGCLFFMAAVFFVANTIRLVIYARRDEIEIMRLVGAEDRFIKTPLYIEGMVLGLVGGVLGIAVLFAAFIVISVNLDDALIPAAMQIRFLPPHAFGGILVSSVLVGWLGCFVSLKQFLRS